MTEWKNAHIFPPSLWTATPYLSLRDYQSSKAEGGWMKLSYKCDEKLNRMIEREAARQEITKQAFFDNLIRDYFKLDHKDSYVISDKKLRDRERKRSRETIGKFNEIIEKYDELLDFMDRIFDTRWASREESEEFRKIVVKLIINIAGILESIKKELKK